MNAEFPLNAAELGAALRALRIQAGYRAASAFADALRDELGITVTPRMVYYVESGSHLPRLEVYCGYQALCYRDGIEDALLKAVWQPRPGE